MLFSEYYLFIPLKVYRKLEHSIPLLSSHDRAPQLHLDDDRLTVRGEKGYSLVRGTHGVRKGRWYFEVCLQSMPKEAAVRVNTLLMFKICKTDNLRFNRYTGSD